MWQACVAPVILLPGNLVVRNDCSNAKPDQVRPGQSIFVIMVARQTIPYAGSSMNCMRRPHLSYAYRRFDMVLSSCK